LLGSLPGANAFRAKRSVGKGPNSKDNPVTMDAHRSQQCLFTRRLRATIPLKIKPLCAFFQTHIFDSDLHLTHKCLLFAHHQEIINAMCQMLDDRKMPYILIKGGVTLASRLKMEKSFQTDPHMRFAVLSIQACATGITLTAATQAFFAETLYNPSQMLQAEDRCYRIGTKEQVYITRLLMRDSIDEITDRIEQTKLKNYTAIMKQPSAEASQSSRKRTHACT
jgi:SNF2 family DNA or RNA helicase